MPLCPPSWARRPLTPVALVALLVLAVGGCGSASDRPSAATTVAAPTTTTAGPTTTAAPTTTTAPTTTAPATSAVPSSPQGSDDVAAADLIADWKAGDRASALHVATEGAVATLFATAYGGQTVIGRGCQDVEFPPVICSYGPEGGANASDHLYQLTVTQIPAGWYVSTVVVE